MRVLFWSVVLFVALVLALFAASNRENVALGLWPLPVLAEMPLYLVGLGALLLGFVAGETAAWIGGRRRRRAARQCTRCLAALQRELAATQAQLAGTRSPRAVPPAVAVGG